MPYLNSRWTTENLKRLQQLLSEGTTQKECGNIFGVKPQRIEQVIKRYNLFSNRSEFGAHKRAVMRKAELDKIYQNKRGFSKETRMEALKNKDTLLNKCFKKFQNKKHNSWRLGIPFDITFEDIKFPTHCPILGIELNYYFLKGCDDANPTFDRINPKLGYIKGNVHVISHRANRIKNDSTLEELKKLVHYLEGMEKKLDNST